MTRLLIRMLSWSSSVFHMCPTTTSSSLAKSYWMSQLTLTPEWIEFFIHRYIDCQTFDIGISFFNAYGCGTVQSSFSGWNLNLVWKSPSVNNDQYFTMKLLLCPATLNDESREINLDFVSKKVGDPSTSDCRYLILRNGRRLLSWRGF